MRYRLRTLLILLAVVPPMLAGAWLAGRTIFPTVICFVALVSGMATLTTDNG